MSPLYQRLTALILPLFFTGCSSTADIPAFSASGYLADRGAVRIWRKNSVHQSIHLHTIFTPFNSDMVETTDYIWLEDALISVQRKVRGKQTDNVTLRFDQKGHLNFMQCQLAGRREAVSPNAVELYKFDAQRMRKVSDALLSGQVLLKQGHWQGSHTVQTCEGQQVTPAFDANALQTLAQQQRGAKIPLMVSWLEAPEGVQLLLVSQRNDCAEQPKEADL